MWAWAPGFDHEGPYHPQRIPGMTLDQGDGLPDSRLHSRRALGSISHAVRANSECDP